MEANLREANLREMEAYLREMEANAEAKEILRKKIRFLSSLDGSALKKIYFHCLETNDIENLQLCFLAGADINWLKGESYHCEKRAGPAYAVYHRLIDDVIDRYM